MQVPTNRGMTTRFARASNDLCGYLFSEGEVVVPIGEYLSPMVTDNARDGLPNPPVIVGIYSGGR
ncbi:hypothetical protein JCM9803A_63600 [Rhodococcus erythropolis]